MPVTDEEVVTQLRELLKTADMETTTERKLRQALEKYFSEDLTSKKHVVSEEVKRYLAEADAQEEDQDEDADEDDEAAGDSESEAGGKSSKSSKAQPPPKKKRKASTTGGNPLSPELSAFLGGVEIMQRCQVVSKLWEYIKANKLQDPAKKSNIIPDKKMLTLFTTPLNQFSMNKQLSKHILPKDPNAPQRSPKPKKPKTEGENGESKPNALQKPVRVSPELGSWLGGVSEISRPQLTSAFWKYVKDNKLQDPANKKTILADPKLKELTGEDSFIGFGFMKLFSKHILKD